ncbi:MAG: prepilin-type N-terminal cleavage/methylation domain-containing protein [Planctomycetes bacterium]|nr:prepilin-type N-terminal cleavage/methylation domain-containing protein [Planctomycetota bacterium]
MNRRTRSGNRYGFTLIEVLLSLGLMVVLMLAMYTVFDLYQRVTVSGRDDVERAQIARAVMRKIELDLRSCIFLAPQEEASDGETGSEEFIIEEIDTQAAVSGSTTGIVGDLDSIVIITSRPGRSMDYSSFLSDMRSVSYFLADPGATGLRGTVANLAIEQIQNQDEDSYSGVQGLARLEGDRLAMGLADEQADEDALAENTRILATEINYLQFHYFDGVEWVDVWDSTEMGGLPQAVEIVIGFRPPAGSASAAAAGAETDVTMDLHRYVVSFPLSEPAVLIQQGL